MLDPGIRIPQLLNLKQIYHSEMKQNILGEVKSGWCVGIDYPT